MPRITSAKCPESHFPGVWRHGDFAALTEHDGVIIFGRSDALLNIGGIRVGTSELYAVVERFAAIAESVAIAQEWQGDARIILFVRMAEGPASTSNCSATSAPPSPNNPSHPPVEAALLRKAKTDLQKTSLDIPFQFSHTSPSTII